MRYLLYISVIILFVASCKEQQQIKEEIFISNPDTALSKQVLGSLDSLKLILIKTHIKDRVLQQENDKLIIQIDSLQKKVIGLQLDKMDLIIIQKKFTKLKQVNKAFIDKIISLKNTIEELRDSNTIAANDLVLQKQYNNKIYKDKTTLQNTMNEASKLKIAGVKILSYGTTLLGKEVEVEKASRVKRISVYFITPENEIYKQKKYTIVATLHGVSKYKDNKDSVQVNYVGKEHNYFISFNKSEEFHTGHHKVELTNGNDTLYTGEINFK